MEIGIQNFKNKKTTAELDHSDLISVYKSSFTQMPISQENLNVFWSDSVTVVAELNNFIFMQIYYSRWPPGAITKTGNNTKMTISKNHRMKLIQFCARMFFV